MSNKVTNENVIEVDNTFTVDDVIKMDGPAIKKYINDNIVNLTNLDEFIDDHIKRETVEEDYLALFNDARHYLEVNNNPGLAMLLKDMIREAGDNYGIDTKDYKGKLINYIQSCVDVNHPVFKYGFNVKTLRLKKIDDCVVKLSDDIYDVFVKYISDKLNKVADDRRNMNGVVDDIAGHVRNTILTYLINGVYLYGDINFSDHLINAMCDRLEVGSKPSNDIIKNILTIVSSIVDVSLSNLPTKTTNWISQLVGLDSEECHKVEFAMTLNEISVTSIVKFDCIPYLTNEPDRKELLRLESDINKCLQYLITTDLEQGEPKDIMKPFVDFTVNKNYKFQTRECPNNIHVILLFECLLDGNVLSKPKMTAWINNFLLYVQLTPLEE